MNTNHNKNLFNLYTFLLFGIMPFIVTPFWGDIYYNGKIIFSFIITFLLIIYILFENKNYLFEAFDKITIFLIIYSILLIFSFLFSINKKISLFGQIHSREGLIVLFLYLVVFYIFYRFYSPSLIVLESILVCVTLICLLGILQYLGFLPYINEFATNPWEKGTPLSTIGNRNFVGTFCTIFLPIAIGYWFFISKIRGYFYIGIIFAFLLVSQTRSAWIAFIVYIFLFLFFNIKNKNLLFKWIALFLSILFIAFLMNQLSDNEIQKRLYLMISDFLNFDDNSSGSNRILYWKRALLHIFDHPFLGYGIDTYGVFYRQTYGYLKLYFEKVHNEYMHMAFTMGFPILIMYISLVSKILLGLLSRIKIDPISQVIFCCITGYLIQAIFNLSMLPNAILFWAILGIGFKIVMSPSENH